MRKILTVLLTLSFVLKMAAKEMYVVVNEGLLTFYYDDKRASREGETYDIEKWRYYITEELRTSLTKAVFDPSFADARPTSTSKWFFCVKNIKEIEGLEYLNTSQVTDMSSMFQYCGGLRSLDVSHFDTSNVTDMSGMFYDLVYLESLDVRHFNTSKVTNMSCMFYAMRNVKFLDVSHFDTSNVTDVRFMFSGCWELTNIDVSHFDTSKIQGMEYMFAECYALKELDVSHFDTSNVTSMERLFYCTCTLRMLDVSHFDTSNVTNMKWMFSGCGTTALDVTNFDTSNVVDMGLMFAGCTNLEALDLHNFDTRKVTDMQRMFGECESFTELDLTSFNTSNVTTMWYMFNGCKNLTSLNVSSFDTSNVVDMSRMFGTCSSLPELSITHFNTSKVTDMSKMFEYCTNLEYLDLSSFDTSEVKDMWCMFSWSGFVSLDLSSFNTDKVTRMEGMFNCCLDLSDLKLPNFSNSNVTTMDGMFKDCKSLTSLDLSHFYTGKVTNMHWMFRGCENLQSLDLRSFDTNNVEDMGEMFFACINLTCVDLSSFNTNNVSNMCAMFWNCEKLKTLDVSNFNTCNVGNMGGMFAGCTGLTSLNLSNFTTSEGMALWSFIPYTLQELTLGPDIKYADDETFNAVHLKKIISLAVTPSALSLKAFNDLSYENAVLYVPVGTKSLYETTEGWNKFKKIVEMGETLTIELGETGKLSFCSDKSLDFCFSDEVKAFAATGYDKREETLWLTRVLDVPAGTPILIKGEPNKTYEIPVTDSQNSYYKNMFVGNISGAPIEVGETNGDLVNYYLSAKDGTFKSVNKSVTLGNGKCYLQLPSTFEPVANAEDIKVTMPATGKMSFAAPVDLYFSNFWEISAFTATGFDKKTNTIWLTRVWGVQKGEPLLLKGEANKEITLPSRPVQSSYMNMFKGNTSGNDIQVQEKSEDGSQTNFYLTIDGTFVSVNGYVNIKNNKCYLELPTDMVSGGASTRGAEKSYKFEEPEVLKLPISFRSIDNNSDGTTGIRETKQLKEDGAYYTLQGQRVQNPGKGLYIKDGKKVVIK